MNEYLLTRELAELLRTPESTLRYWRHTRTGPPSLKVGRRVLYRRSAVLTWLDGLEGSVPEMPPPRDHGAHISGSVRRRTT